MERFGRRVMFKNKMKKSDGTFLKLREGSSPFKINIVTDCMASLLHKVFFHMSVFPHPSHSKQILFPEPTGLQIFCISFEFTAGLQLLLMHSASLLWFPLHLLRRTVLGFWARGQGGSLTFVHQGEVCCDKILNYGSCAQLISFAPN